MADRGATHGPVSDAESVDTVPGREETFFWGCLVERSPSTARVDVFGMSWDNAGKNSFSAPFAWSA